jgi:phosphinothricin acetyltransferase
MTTDARLHVAPLTSAHAEAVLAVYTTGIATGNATFENAAPTWEAFDAGRLPAHRFVALIGGEVVGWIACSQVSARPAYAGVVEHSVYVDPGHGGLGAGRALLETLISSTEAAGIWTIQSGVFPENTASLALHRRCGFRDIGVRERIGKHNGVWRDVILIERRSPVIV